MLSPAEQDRQKNRARFLPAESSTFTSTAMSAEKRSRSFLASLALSRSEAVRSGKTSEAAAEKKLLSHDQAFEATGRIPFRSERQKPSVITNVPTTEDFTLTGSNLLKSRLEPSGWVAC
jgi:hypothetical protein